ncbi:hypothetical protein ACV3UL_14395 [Clostridium perfringens]
MNKKQAIQMFKDEYSDFLKKKKNDSVAKREAWGNFTDALCKDGEITQKQYNTWLAPSCCD